MITPPSKSQHAVSLIVEAVCRGEITIDEARIALNDAVPSREAKLIIRALNRAVQSPGWNNDNAIKQS